MTITTERKGVLPALRDIQVIRDAIDEVILYRGTEVGAPCRRRLEKIARELSDCQRSLATGGDA